MKTIKEVMEKVLEDLIKKAKEQEENNDWFYYRKINRIVC